jgi:hypothetical protein
LALATNPIIIGKIEERGINRRGVAAHLDAVE